MRSFLLIFCLLYVGVCNSQTTGTMTDTRDGRVYTMVGIGNQTWMAENLRVDRFRNGDPITEAKTNEDWIKACENKQPAWCYYDNDPANGSLLIGVLYNWYAVIDSRGLAPIGWHIPSETEWSIIENYSGGNENGGKKMKAVGAWGNGLYGRNDGTNESGFSARPGGFRTSNGEFYALNTIGMWWSSSSKINKKGIERAFRFTIDYRSDSTVLLGSTLPNEGYSVRCIKDSITTTNNTTSTQTSNTNNKNNSTVKVIDGNSNATLTKEECNSLFMDYLNEKQNGSLEKAISLLTVSLNKCNSSDEKGKEYILRCRAELYKEKADFSKAISDYKSCEAILNNYSDEDRSKISVFDNLSECYEKIGDLKNQRIYKEKSDNVSNSRREKLKDAEIEYDTDSKLCKKYCYNNYSGKYELALFDDVSKRVIYKLYNNNGTVDKTMQGKWEKRDEGLYGSAFKIVITWTGKNSGLPETKYLCQYDGFGNLQSLSDIQNRTWNPCK